MKTLHVGGKEGWRWLEPREQRVQPPESAAPSRRMRPVSAHQPDDLQKRLGYCPDLPRRPRERDLSFLSDLVPATHLAWTCGKLPKGRPPPNPPPEEDDQADKAVHITELRDYCILKFRGEGDRLLVKRRQRGWSELPKRPARSLQSRSAPLLPPFASSRPLAFAEAPPALPADEEEVGEDSSVVIGEPAAAAAEEQLGGHLPMEKAVTSLFGEAGGHC